MLAVASEGFYDPPREPYGTARSVLRLGEDKSAGFLPVPAHALKLAIDPERAGIEVDVRSLEPQRLPLSEPGHEAEDVEGLVTISACRLEERPRLISVEGLYLPLADPRLGSVGGGVPLHDQLADRPRAYAEPRGTGSI